MKLSDFDKYKEYGINLVAKKYDQAENALLICIDQAKRENDTNTFIFLIQRLGDLYFFKGNIDKAISTYAESEKLDSSLWTKYCFAKFLANLLKRYEQAIDKTEGIVKIALNSSWPETEEEFSSDFYLAQSYALQGYCYSRLGDYKNASEEFRHFTEIGCTVQDYDIDLCDALISNGYCIAEAKKYLTSVLTKFLKRDVSQSDEKFVARIRDLINRKE